MRQLSMKDGLLAVGLLFFSPGLEAQFAQQGPELVGTGAGDGGYYNSVALSSDGNTALVGKFGDYSSAGTAWVFTRTAGVWTQQGPRLLGTGVVGFEYQGRPAVALSSDGDTALIGGGGDNSGTGAAWVFTRSGGVWTQQGSKLVGTGAVGGARQGDSVALSSDGNTALLGGPGDSTGTGAAWVFTRSGGVWTQQGPKLTGAGGVGTPYLGGSVALSADGNTALVGGAMDSFPSGGATWVFTRSGGVWTQQGPKLVGTGGVGNALQSSSVALSADGDTAVMGGPADSIGIGAAWVFARSGGLWMQQGPKLVGTGAVGIATQGRSVGLSFDGNTALVGGPFDSTGTGAAWVFTRSGGVWTQQGSKLVGSGALGTRSQGESVALSSDGETASLAGGYPAGAWVFATPDASPGFPVPDVPAMQVAGLLSLAILLVLLGLRRIHAV